MLAREIMSDLDPRVVLEPAGETSRKTGLSSEFLFFRGFPSLTACQPPVVSSHAFWYVPHGWRVIATHVHVGTAMAYGPGFVTFDLVLMLASCFR